MSYKPLCTAKFFRQQQNEQWLKRNQFRPKQMWRNQLSWFWKKAAKRNKQEKPRKKANGQLISQPRALLRGFLNMIQNTVVQTPFKFQFWTQVLKVRLGCFQLLISIPDAVLVFYIFTGIGRRSKFPYLWNKHEKYLVTPSTFFSGYPMKLWLEYLQRGPSSLETGNWDCLAKL